jgi:hypothetical protein
MEFIKKLDLSWMQFLKLIGLVAIALVTLSFLNSNFSSGTSLQSAYNNAKNAVSGTDSYYAATEDSFGYGAPELSVRNIAPDIMPPLVPSYVPGNDAEDFEVKEYSATIETSSLAKDCEEIRNLMKREDVIFENANEYEKGCNYSFKVEKDSVEAVLAIIESMDPKDLNENSYTIKREVTDYTSEIEILENKLASLDKTLTEALASYESVSRQATNVGDVESLAKIIDSKLNMIERLTSARIDTSAQLDRINRAKAESLDRLIYTNFYVNVYENKIIDGGEMKDSWTAAAQKFARDINTLVQELSIGFVALLLMLVKFALYGFVLLLAARFGYNFARKVWQAGEGK